MISDSTQNDMTSDSTQDEPNNSGQSSLNHNVNVSVTLHAESDNESQDTLGSYTTLPVNQYQMDNDSSYVLHHLRNDVTENEIDKNDNEDPCLDDIIYVFSDEETTIDAIMYIAQIPSDKHTLFRWYVYFIPSKQIEIYVRVYNEYLASSDMDTVYISQSQKANNVYRIDGKIYQSQIKNIFVKKQWINACIESFKLRQQLKIVNNKIFITAPILKTRLDVAKELFDQAYKYFECRMFDISRDIFMKCIKTVENTSPNEYLSLCKYNISCSYALEANIDDALLSLSEACIAGYNNWEHTITDPDMKTLLENDKFIEMIKSMMLTNSKRRTPTYGIPKEYNAIDDFIEKNNLREFTVKKSKKSKKMKSKIIDPDDS